MLKYFFNLDSSYFSFTFALTEIMELMEGMTFHSEEWKVPLFLL